MNKQEGRVITVIFILVAAALVAVLYFLTRDVIFGNYEINAFIVAAIIILIGFIYIFLSGGQVKKEDELLELLAVSNSRIFSLVDNAQKPQPLQIGKGHDLQSEQILNELAKLSAILSDIRKANRFKRLDRAEEISKKIASAIKKVEAVRRQDDLEKFYSAFQGPANIILDVHRICQDLQTNGNWFLAR